MFSIGQYYASTVIVAVQSIPTMDNLFIFPLLVLLSYKFLVNDSVLLLSDTKVVAQNSYSSTTRTWCFIYIKLVVLSVDSN